MSIPAHPVIKGRKECYFTPHKGTGTCYDCQFSYNPELSDSGCKLSYEEWQTALRGENPFKDKGESK